MTDNSVSIDRLVAPAYARFHDPAHTIRTRFGWFVRHPDFPDRWDANQLFNVRCEPTEIGDLLTELDELYSATDIPYRMMEFHDATTVEVLIPTLRAKGWRCWPRFVMQFLAKPKRTTNSDLIIRSVSFADPEGDRAAMYAEHDRLRSFQFRQSQDERLGGEVLIGYLDGYPVGHAGWFIVDGVVRFRPIGTRTVHRNKNVATTLVRYVQEHPTVREADTLCLFCDEDGPKGLYEELGFVKRGQLWSALLETPR